MVSSLLDGTEPELVENTYFKILLQKMILPALYKPLDKLDTFFQENRHLFTLIGVFGAVSIYLRTVDEELEETAKLAGEFALVTGFAIVLLLSFLVIVKLTIFMRGTEAGIISFGNIALGLFGIFFTFLMLIVGGLISTLSTVWAFYGFLFVYSGSIVSVFISAISLSKVEDYISSKVGIHETILGAIIFSLLTLFLLTAIGVTGVLKPEAITEITDGGSLQQWFDVYITLTITIFTVFSMALSGLFLTATILGMVLAVLFSVKSKANQIRDLI